MTTTKEQLSNDLHDLSFMTSLVAMDYESLNPTVPRIGTMTISITTNVKDIVPRPDFLREFEQKKQKVVKAMNTDSKSFIFSCNEDGKSMGNGVIFKSQLSSKGKNKVVKIFRNGNAQLNGVNSEEDLAVLCLVLCSALNTAFNVCDVKVMTLGTRMITSSFSCGTPVKLHELVKIISESGVDVVYNTAIYAGMRYKVGSATMSVFSTGNVLILGAKEVKDITAGFDSLMSFISTNYERVHMDEEMVLRESKKKGGSAALIDEDELQAVLV